MTTGLLAGTGAGTCSWSSALAGSLESLLAEKGTAPAFELTFIILGQAASALAARTRGDMPTRLQAGEYLAHQAEWHIRAKLSDFASPKANRRNKAR